MKTPREILFQRHQAAEPKLDAIRQHALARLVIEWSQGAQRPVSNDVAYATRFEPASPQLWRMLVSFRWHLTALSAAWLVILLLNIEPSPAPASSVAKQHSPSPSQLLMAVRENRRQLSELIESPLSAPVHIPGPRSQTQTLTATA